MPQKNTTKNILKKWGQKIKGPLAQEQRATSQEQRFEQDRVEKLAENPEDPGSEVDWGDESVKDEKEEPSSEGDEGEEKPIVPASAAEPAAVPGDSPAGAVDPLKELTEEELKLVAIWAHRPAGYQRAVECLLLGAHKLLEKEAATKEGERAALEKSISEDLGLSSLPGEVLNRLVTGKFSVEEEAELEKLETSQATLAVQARAVRLQSLRRLLNHASTAGSVLEARLRGTGVFSEVVEAFDKAEANRQADDQARDALFRRQIADIQAGRSTRTVPQVVREARRRLRAKKHRLQVSAKLNAEISAALREKVLDGSRDVRLTPDTSWRVKDNLSELDYPPGTWWCRRCQGTSQGTSDCQGYHKGKRCNGSFATTFHSWARTSVGAELLRAAGKRRSERVREEIAPQLKDAGWTCNRCQADNLALRNKCYRCSGSISQVQLQDLAEIREDLRADPRGPAREAGLNAKEEVSLVRQVLLVGKVVLAAILSVRRIARSQSPEMEKKDGPVGTDGAEETTAEIGTREVGTKMMIVPDGRTGMIKSGTVPRGRTGMIQKTKMMATSGMVGRAGVADVDCLAKVRWLTRPAASGKSSFSQARSFQLSSPFRIGCRSSLRVWSRSHLLSSSLSIAQGLSLGVSSGGRFALLLRCCLARGRSSYMVFVVSLVSECGSS